VGDNGDETPDWKMFVIVPALIIGTWLLYHFVLRDLLWR